MGVGVNGCEQVSKKTQDDMVDLSMGLRVFMTETEEKLNSKADAKALLQKAGWTEVRDLMGELSAHMSEKLHHSSSELKGLNERISTLGGKSGASGLLKCISCSRPVPAQKNVSYWSKSSLDPDGVSGGDAHVQRIKTAAAHHHSPDKMPAIDGARHSGLVWLLTFTSFTALPALSPARPATQEIRCWPCTADSILNCWCAVTFAHLRGRCASYQH